jgi:hypothetical protein
MEGIRPSVSMVEQVRPAITVIARGDQRFASGLLSTAMGNKPNMVVKVVIIIGRSRLSPLIRTALKPFMAFVPKRFISSIKMIALLTTMPPNIIAPIRTPMFTDFFMTSRVIITPMAASGTVAMIINGWE